MSATDDDPDPWVCEVCGAELERIDCWQCHGEGGFHDCGEDVCCCLDGDEITEDCGECDGDGFEVFCPNAAAHPQPNPRSDP